MANSVRHFTHSAHPLFFISNRLSYKCDFCERDGTGNRYRCSICDFDVHEHCINYSFTINTTLHGHPVSLVQYSRTSNFCDSCRQPAKGYIYRCNQCDFDLHPACSGFWQNNSQPRGAYSENAYSTGGITSRGTYGAPPSNTNQLGKFNVAASNIPYAGQGVGSVNSLIRPAGRGITGTGGTMAAAGTGLAAGIFGSAVRGVSFQAGAEIVTAGHNAIFPSSTNDENNNENNENNNHDMYNHDNNYEPDYDEPDYDDDVEF